MIAAIQINSSSSRFTFLVCRLLQPKAGPIHWSVWGSGVHEGPCWRSGVKATGEWLVAAGAAFTPRSGRYGCAHLSHYTAQYCEWGEGPPLVLIPGLAGGFELLGPLARILARKYRVIAYQLRGEDD